MKTDLFQSCGHCWVFQICWHIECSTFTASSFRRSPEHRPQFSSCPQQGAPLLAHRRFSISSLPPGSCFPTTNYRLPYIYIFSTLLWIPWCVTHWDPVQSLTYSNSITNDEQISVGFSSTNTYIKSKKFIWHKGLQWNVYFLLHPIKIFPHSLPGQGTCYNLDSILRRVHYVRWYFPYSLSTTLLSIAIYSETIPFLKYKSNWV